MKTFALSIMLVASAVVANAQRLIQTPRQASAVATVKTDETVGTGVLIRHKDAASYVLTNEHVVKMRSGLIDKRVTIRFDDRNIIDGDVLGTDAANDLALVKLDRQPAITAIPIMRRGTFARQGEQVVTIGFNGSSKMAIQSAVSGYSRKAANTPMNVLTIPKQTAKGASGAPVIRNGELCGLVLGHLTYYVDDYGRRLGIPEVRTAATSVNEIHQFVDATSPKLARPAQAIPFADLQASTSQGSGGDSADDIEEDRIPKLSDPITSNQAIGRCATNSELQQRLGELARQIEDLRNAPPPVEKIDIDEDQLVQLIVGLIPSKEDIAAELAEHYAEMLRGEKGDTGDPARPMKMRLVFLDGDGNVVSEQEATYPDALKIPAIIVQNYDKDSSMVDRQQYPYPGPIKLRHGRIDNPSGSE